ncbi:hypothetical protein [Ligilactobacillus pobuzihii]|nr:hypothetical protein [Ligilactobacillus pobuzihii]
MENVYEKLRSEVKENEFAPQWSWTDFIIKYKILDALEESVLKIDFE